MDNDIAAVRVHLMTVLMDELKSALWLTTSPDAAHAGGRLTAIRSIARQMGLGELREPSEAEIANHVARTGPDRPPLQWGQPVNGTVEKMALSKPESLAVDSIAVGCPRCESAPGIPCRSVGQDSYARGASLKRSHPERVRIAKGS